MSTFTEFFGRSPRVAILEAFSENPDEDLSVPEIITITGISRRAVYMHINKMIKEGLLINSNKIGKCKYFKFNENDPRGEALVYLESVLTLGNIERNIRIDEGIPLDVPFPYIYRNIDQLRDFHEKQIVNKFWVHVSNLSNEVEFNINRPLSDTQQFGFERSSKIPQEITPSGTS